MGRPQSLGRMTQQGQGTQGLVEDTEPKVCN